MTKPVPKKWPGPGGECFAIERLQGEFQMAWKRSIAAITIVSLFGSTLALHAKASNPTLPEDPLNPAHVETLPREVRASIGRVSRACGAGFGAKHAFSRSIQDRVTGDRFISIHFDETHCDNRAAICTTAGCLHQVYVSKGGPYRVILNVYASEVTLKLVDGATVVEVACRQTADACIGELRWDGSRLRPWKQ
jgi:hypothetical protein